MTRETGQTPVGRRQIMDGALGLGLGGLAPSGVLHARPAVRLDANARKLPGSVSYSFLGRWDVGQLNDILTSTFPAFAGIRVSYPPARHAVRLYRVIYPSVAPERGNRPVMLSGLVALPENDTEALPLVSYQHGTVYLKSEVPSFPERSPETQLMLALFAGQGYALIGADYIGMGLSDEPQGYIVKGSHQQATTDLLPVAAAVMADLGRRTTSLFLAGWSQGGYVTMAMLERLEGLGVPVRAVATASAPTDLWLALSAPLLHPRSNDAPWLTTIFALLAFSYETYYDVPGLARSIIKPSVYDLVERAYRQEPFEHRDMPTDLRAFVNEPYFDADFFSRSAFGRLVRANDAYRWAVRTPVRNHYGEADEAVRPLLARLPMEYQRALGGDRVEAVLTGDDTHRGTFARAAPHWKAWFDSFSPA